MTKLEEIAQRLEGWFRLPAKDRDGYGYTLKEMTEGAARAAVETLREPNAAMIDAIKPLCIFEAWEQDVRDAIKKDLNLVIDAILNEQPTAPKTNPPPSRNP